jgi:hypothetical protein
MLIKWMNTAGLKLFMAENESRHVASWKRASQGVVTHNFYLTASYVFQDVKGLGPEIAIILTAAPWDTFAPTTPN